MPELTVLLHGLGGWVFPVPRGADTQPASASRAHLLLAVGSCRRPPAPGFPHVCNGSGRRARLTDLRRGRMSGTQRVLTQSLLSLFQRGSHAPRMSV